MLLSSKLSKVEKTMEAHTGGILCVKWAHDGSAFATSNIKFMSKVGKMELLKYGQNLECSDLR